MHRICRTCNESKELETAYGVYKIRGVSHYRRECKTCRSEYTRRRYKDNHEVREKMKAAANASRMMKSYGLTVEESEALKSSSGGLCEICGVEEKLHIDHCHTNGNVRGMLCGPCNRGLGLFKDNITSLKNAIKYLGERNNANT